MIISVVIFAGAIAAALDFMGVINLKTMIRQKMRRCALNCGISYLRDMLFRKPAGIAIIHESGCLNIRSTDEYLVQIDVEDDSADDFGMTETDVYNI